VRGRRRCDAHHWRGGCRLPWKRCLRRGIAGSIGASPRPSRSRHHRQAQSPVRNARARNPTVARARQVERNIDAVPCLLTFSGPDHRPGRPNCPEKPRGNLNVAWLRLSALVGAKYPVLFELFHTSMWMSKIRSLHKLRIKQALGQALWFKEPMAAIC
jgi:hypothetical protein